MPRSKSTKLADVTQVDAEDNAAEEYELVSFLDALGPQGISEVTLYRLSATGKQRFVTSGPPSAFTEQTIQQLYGGGDFLIRSRLNGKWFRSKNFSIEGPPIDSNGNHYAINSNGAGDLERLKLDLEAQKLRLQEQQSLMEADRRAQDERNHQLQLALIESSRHTAPAVSVPEMIAGIKSLKELSGDQDQVLSGLEKSLGIIERIANIRGAGNGEAGGGTWTDWLRPIAIEAGKQLLPRVLPFIAPAGTQTPTIATAAPAAIAPAPPAPGPPPDTPTPPVQPIGDPPPGGPTAEEQYLFNKRQALEFIVPISRMGRDPAFYCEAAIEQVETANNAVIARFVDEIVKAESFEIWFRELQAIEPTVITSQHWFELFFNTMRDLIAEKSDDEQDVK